MNISIDHIHSYTQHSTDMLQAQSPSRLSFRILRIGIWILLPDTIWQTPPNHVRRQASYPTRLSSISSFYFNIPRTEKYNRAMLSKSYQTRLSSYHQIDAFKKSTWFLAASPINLSVSVKPT